MRGKLYENKGNIEDRTYIHTCIHMYEQEEEDDGQEIKDKKENCRERQDIFI